MKTLNFDKTFKSVFLFALGLIFLNSWPIWHAKALKSFEAVIRTYLQYYRPLLKILHTISNHCYRAETILQNIVSYFRQLYIKNDFKIRPKPIQSDTIRKKSNCPLFFQFHSSPWNRNKRCIYMLVYIILITVLIWLSAHIFAFTADKQE